MGALNFNKVFDDLSVSQQFSGGVGSQSSMSASEVRSTSGESCTLEGMAETGSCPEPGTILYKIGHTDPSTVGSSNVNIQLNYKGRYSLGAGLQGFGIGYDGKYLPADHVLAVAPDGTGSVEGGPVKVHSGYVFAAIPVTLGFGPIDQKMGPLQVTVQGKAGVDLFSGTSVLGMTSRVTVQNISVSVDAQQSVVVGNHAQGDVAQWGAWQACGGYQFKSRHFDDTIKIEACMQKASALTVTRDNYTGFPRDIIGQADYMGGALQLSMLFGSPASSDDSVSFEGGGKAMMKGAAIPALLSGFSLYQAHRNAAIYSALPSGTAIADFELSYAAATQWQNTASVSAIAAGALFGLGLTSYLIGSSDTSTSAPRVQLTGTGVSVAGTF